MTIDLEQPDKPAEVVDLMKDGSSYVQAELPRVNPAHKGRAYRRESSLDNHSMLLHMRIYDA